MRLGFHSVVCTSAGCVSLRLVAASGYAVCFVADDYVVIA